MTDLPKWTMTTTYDFDPNRASVPKTFGWTPSLPDHRDEEHAYRAPLGVKLPPKVNLVEGWDQEPFNPVWPQGNTSTCGPHAAAADIVYAVLRQQKQARCPMPSRLFIYYYTRYLMGTLGQDSGVRNREMLTALKTYGWCDEGLFPFVPRRMDETPVPAAIRQAATRKIAAYRSVRQDLDTMRACLAGGDPFILGFSVYSSIDTPEVDRTGDIPYPTMGDRKMGGHDVLVVGYDDGPEQFLIRNSWQGWGKQGYGTIPYRYATNRNLAGDFWTVEHGAYEIQPAPAPQPTERVIQVKAGERLVIEGVA